MAFTGPSGGPYRAPTGGGPHRAPPGDFAPRPPSRFDSINLRWWEIPQALLPLPCAMIAAAWGDGNSWDWKGWALFAAACTLAFPLWRRNYLYRRDLWRRWHSESRQQQRKDYQ
jgi:hypothetical protein